MKVSSAPAAVFIAAPAALNATRVPSCRITGERITMRDHFNRREFLATTSSAFCVAVVGTGASAEPIRFAYHSSFCMNLHHRLYREAMALRFERNGEKLVGRQPQLYADLQSVPEAGGEQWHSAVEFYLKTYTSRDLLFDDELTNIKTTLALAPDLGSRQPPAKLPDRLAQMLAGAAPLYRSTFWPEDNHANERWIAATTPLVDRFGDGLSNRLASIYRTPYPRGPYRIDIVRDANFFDAYTTDYPFVHIVISSAAPANNGRAALETLYHEASHAIVFPDAGSVGGTIDAQAKHERLTPPDELWHAVIFYTTGTACREAFAAASQAPYVMFADNVGLFKTAWPTYREPLERYWKRYLDGREPFGRALDRTVVAVLSTESQKAKG